MKTSFLQKSQALIGVVHLKPLPGAPRWDGNFKALD
jgi:predicted TIM-barrel enzyme